MILADTHDDGFAASRAHFEQMVGFLDGGAAALDHGELEDRLQSDGRELLRLLFQDHLDLRAVREPRVEQVSDADGVGRPCVEAGHGRTLASVFGAVRVQRLAYRRRGHANLHPADGVLNLPPEKHSHGLRRLAAGEAARGSFDDAVTALEGATGQWLGKRQVEDLAGRAAVDFQAYYDSAERPTAEEGQVVVISADGKGIVMRPEGLRPATATKAARSQNKLKGRLSKGEKANRKRMAEVGAVYTVEQVPRCPDDIMARCGEGKPKQAPKARHKWLTASVAEDAATVIARVFDEAERRDPLHQRPWVALVDGNRHQIDRIQAEAQARDITLTVVVDWVHVLEYLWAAAWSFFPEGDPAAEHWVHHKAIDVLAGKATTVAAAIRRKATTSGLDAAARKNADACADYLLAKAPYLDYPTALQNGWPIATGVIEGACRHTCKEPAGACKEPKPYSSYGYCEATTTGTTTGPST